jgi:hypothetical protein
MAKTKSRDPKSTRSQKADRPLAADDFASVARRLECDEDKGRFEVKLGKIAKAKTASQK